MNVHSQNTRKPHEGYTRLMGGNDFQFEYMLLTLKPMRTVSIQSFKHFLSIRHYQARFLNGWCLTGDAYRLEKGSLNGKLADTLSSATGGAEAKLWSAFKAEGMRRLHESYKNGRSGVENTFDVAIDLCSAKCWTVLRGPQRGTTLTFRHRLPGQWR